MSLDLFERRRHARGRPEAGRDAGVRKRKKNNQVRASALGNAKLTLAL